MKTTQFNLDHNCRYKMQVSNRDEAVCLQQIVSEIMQGEEANVAICDGYLVKDILRFCIRNVTNSGIPQTSEAGLTLLQHLERHCSIQRNVNEDFASEWSRYQTFDTGAFCKILHLYEYQGTGRSNEEIKCKRCAATFYLQLHHDANCRSANGTDDLNLPVIPDNVKAFSPYGCGDSTVVAVCQSDII